MTVFTLGRDGSALVLGLLLDYSWLARVSFSLSYLAEQRLTDLGSI